ncbi:splicing factor, partial [Reticulomyxa filosa]
MNINRSRNGNNGTGQNLTAMTSDMRRAYIGRQSDEIEQRLNEFEQEYMVTRDHGQTKDKDKDKDRDRDKDRDIGKEKEKDYSNGSDNYSITQQTHNPSPRRVKRRLTLELKEIMQEQLNEGSFQHNTLPSQIYQMEDVLKQLHRQKQPLQEIELQGLLQRLQDMRLAHENSLEDLKKKSWN